MACFREHGYEATSIRQLEAATGLRATSLYNAYGSKAGMFDAVLDRYHTDVVERRAREHLDPVRGLDGIRSFFVSTYTVEPSPAHGCLVANSAIEYAALTTRARRKVRRSLVSIRSALTAVLEAARATGTLDAAVDVRATADALLILYEGMLTIARTGTTIGLDISQVIDAYLAQLNPKPPRRSP
jgi:TetR/AcrR family transcriptional regulator, transcriptional repressor for nem operon